MSELIIVLLMGMLISFLGSLPLGSLNISAMQIAITENTQKAVWFAFGVALVEIIYVRLSLTGIHWVMQHSRLFRILEWATVVLFVILAASSFWAARKKNINQKNVLLNNKLPRFWLGFTMSAINPVQIPFWFIWSTYLISNKILQAANVFYNFYMAGIALGTIVGLLLFIFGGRWLVLRLKAGHRIINIVVGLVFIISAVFQLYRILNKPFNAGFE